jgi:3-oxoacyl-[acyl-carrier-protein] synthase II
VSSTKGSTGHLLGAAGALEAAFTVQALVDQVLPPTLNLEHLDDDKEITGILDFVREVQHMDASQSESLDVALSNSFGFGGTNVSLIFERPDLLS